MKHGVVVIDSRYTIASVQRSLMILKLFNSERNKMTLSELSRLSGINKSSILRIITTLTQESFLKYDEISKRYSLGIELFRLGTVFGETMDLRNISREYIEKVSDETGLIVHLGILEESHVVIIEKLLPKQFRDSIAMVSKVGGVVPLHCTGVGKVLLSFQDDSKIDKLLKGYEYKKYSDKTISSYDELMAAIKTIRKNGYGINDGEHEPYIKCYTFPIFNYNNEIVAAMSLTGVVEKMNTYDSEYLVNTLREVTLKISSELGYKKVG